MTQNQLLPRLLIMTALLLLLGGLGAYWPQLVGADDAIEARAAAATVDNTFTYQGYLTDSTGQPYNGTVVMRFQIYNASSGGTLLYNGSNINVPVNGGLFAVNLPATSTTFSLPGESGYDLLNGEALWIAHHVGGELLTPRQEILPAPLAHSLRPGAVVKATASGIPNNYAFEVNMDSDVFGNVHGAIGAETTTGNAVYGFAPNGRALSGRTQDGFAVYGYDGGSAANEGYGGYFYSANGIGVYGYSNGDRTHPNIFAPGVYGESNRGVGVYGRGDTSNSNSFYNEGGRFEGGTGVYAVGSDSDGHGGDFRGNDGVRARGTGAGGYGGEFFSNQYRGIFAQSSGVYYDGYFGTGIGISANGFLDRSGRSQSLVVNMGDTMIAPGDLVAMVGIGSNPENGEPLLGVAKLDSSNRNGVIGVASGAISAETVTAADGSSRIDFAPSNSAITPNSHLVIITDGLAAAVNVTSLTRDASWQIGDRIALTATAAMGRTDDADDTISIGKVAGPIDSETNTIPVFIDID